MVSLKYVKEKLRAIKNKTFQEEYFTYEERHKKLDRFDNKIYIVKWGVVGEIKGINIDSEIVYRKLKTLGLDVEFLYIPYKQLQVKTIELEKIPLDRDIYIFSEVLFPPLYDYLFQNQKDIIHIPNIDSYTTYLPIVETRETDYLKTMQKYSKNGQYFIWCKTQQIYNWLKRYSLDNIHYTHFSFDLCKPTFSKSKKKDYVLLDTGTSMTQRKYLTEILLLFAENPSIPFTLLVKTNEKIYETHIKPFLEKHPSNNKIEFIVKIMTDAEMSDLYESVSYFFYASKFDGYGLSVAQAIRHNLFIFCMNGKPWNELLDNYPRKALFKCSQDMTKGTGGKIGYALSQIYYKADFDDILNKLYDKQRYDKIIKETELECNFFNYFNQTVFQSNLYNFFQKYNHKSNYYNLSNIGMCSFVDRGIIMLENLFQIIFQTGEIYIYLNSTSRQILNYLNKFSNITVLDRQGDLKAISKLKTINHFNQKYNLIIDDDIIYPSDYVEYTCSLLDQLPEGKVYSYNGYTQKYKYSFTQKFQPPGEDEICNLGTGTLFYKSFQINDNVLIYKSFQSFQSLQTFQGNDNSDIVDKKKLSEFLSTVTLDDHIYCDDFFQKYTKSIGLECRIVSPKYSNWMKNNLKILLTKNIGCYEYKIKHNLKTHQKSSTLPLDHIYVDAPLEPKKKEKIYKKFTLSEDAFFRISSQEDDNLVLKNCRGDYLYSLPSNFFDNREVFEKESRKISLLYYFQKKCFNFITIHELDEKSTESYIINSFNKFGVKAQRISLKEFIKEQDKYINCFNFYNLKIPNRHIDQIKIDLIGYTFDLIDYKYDIRRKQIMEYNIKRVKLSFLKEPVLDEHCIQIFQPTKTEPYNILEIQNEQVKLVHFGRINSNRFGIITDLAQILPSTPIFLYGCAEGLTEQHRDQLARYPNIIRNEAKVFGKEIYNIIKENNTFVLSLSERPNMKYYSNRIPMILGYRGLLLQQHFDKVEEVFNHDEILVFKDVKEIPSILSLLINDFPLQQKYKQKGFERSKDYSFENYVLEILSNL